MVLQRVISVARRKASVSVHQATTRLAKAVSWPELVSMVIILISHYCVSQPCDSLHVPRYVDFIASSLWCYRLNQRSSGPSYKRGPPKGYIHAIEQRWHQVESLLGAIIQCSDPQVQGLVSALSQDDLAREILRRVDNGPYVCLYTSLYDTMS